MKTIALSIILFLTHLSFAFAGGDLGESYINAYKDFYPTRVLAMGMQSSLFHFEDYSENSIQNWVAFNQDMLRKLSNPNTTYVKENSINARLLKLQIRSEIDKWTVSKVHEETLSLYTRLIGNATNKILDNDYLSAREKSVLLCNRFDEVQQLCNAAMELLEGGQKKEIERGIKSLERSVTQYQINIPEKIMHLPSSDGCDDLGEKSKRTADEIERLIAHVQETVLKASKDSKMAIGEAEYARRLKLYTDFDINPQKLKEMALEEIETVKDLMWEVSKTHLQRANNSVKLPEQRDALIRLALADMEKDAPQDGADYLSFWLELRDAAIDFIEKKDIVTLPDFQTLRILNAPESAGPAARIGWVGVAPTFDPNPVTTLYLPSIPDTMPAQEQKDFWASFNKPFNRMIVIHELIPGHYHQKKIFRESPHAVRLFFPYALYTEGYATFTERVLLDEGWESDNPLTYLAHLRKRLENANRAYTSMQMHCNNWTEDMVMEFSTETSLLAPQFAKSLWGRISQRPMQVISYFLGSKQFSSLFDYEKERLGDEFVLKDFMDTILKIGPIPTDEYYAIFSEAKKSK